MFKWKFKQFAKCFRGDPLIEVSISKTNNLHLQDITNLTDEAKKWIINLDIGFKLADVYGEE